MDRYAKPWTHVAIVACAALVGLVAASPALAQDDDLTRRLEQQLRQAEEQYALRANPALTVGERAMLDYGARVNFTFFALDDTNQRTRILRQYDNQLYGYLNIDGVHQFYGRMRFQYRDFNDGDSFDGGGDRLVDPLSDRYWYQFDLRRAIEAYEGRISENNLTVRMGRQYVKWASGLVFSDQLYAIDASLELGNEWVFRGVFGMTPQSTVIDFDSSRPSFDGDTERLFLGGMATWTGWTDHKPYFYVMKQWDRNNEDSTVFLVDVGLPLLEERRTDFNYESIYFALGSNGRFSYNLLYEAEFIYEIGQGLSNSFIGLNPFYPQTEEDIRAWAARGMLTWAFHDENLTRIQFETIFASGDEDRVFDTSNTFGGNTPGTDDNAFNAFGYGNTGLAFAAPVSNLMMYRLGASTFPLRNSGDIFFKNWQVGVDAFLFAKMNPHAPFDEDTDSDRILGAEFDVYTNWRLTSDVRVFLQYGVFIPGAAIPDKDERHALITGITYSF